MQRTMSIPEGYLTTTEYAELKGISTQKLDRILNFGEIEYKKIGSRRFIHESTKLCQPPKPPEGYVLLTELCDQKNIPQSLVRRHIYLGNIPYFKTRSKETWIPKTTEFIRVIKTTKAGFEKAQWALKSA